VRELVAHIESSRILIQHLEMKIGCPPLVVENIAQKHGMEAAAGGPQSGYRFQLAALFARLGRRNVFGRRIRMPGRPGCD
jgi:hypothetical protein